ncbi:hypothetical protein L596_021611 [Steinernema carpocapsae]|uniref:Uncharacterized protein n=1 Tax=Steinernema carpocapsae TaxID=34508 RepID=A0A4U5MJ86_STECR|nr:hypothetical protein L596_021611 [Steinernema carpocapsae]
MRGLGHLFLNFAEQEPVAPWQEMPLEQQLQELRAQSTSTRASASPASRTSPRLERSPETCASWNTVATLTSVRTNLEQEAQCKRNHGFVDIRKSSKRVNLDLDSDTLCMGIRDVDASALDITNCSRLAECTDKAIRYSCKSSAPTDTATETPGRVCGALLCDLCNSHIDCVHNT